MKEARDKELKYLRELGVHGSLSAQLWQSTDVTPVDTKWVDTDKAFEGCRCKSVHELLPESAKVETDQTCMRVLTRWKL